MNLPQSLSRLKRRISHPKSPLRQVFRCLSWPARHITAFVAPIAIGAGAAFAQTLTPPMPAVSSSKVEWWEAIILGLVQGLTEFIPVSSSAHLNIVHHWMGHQRELNYDVMLSIGTVIALAYYFRHDWKALIFDSSQKRLRNLVFLSCVPAAVLGVLIHKFEDEPPLSEVWFNAVMLAFAGLILLLADKFSKQNRDIETVGLKDALIIGSAQAIALVPGVSRSGSTLTAGLMLGFKRSDAMRFSFLMSLPISLAAIVYELPRLRHSDDGAAAILLGILFSALSGFWAIGFLLNYLKTKDVTPFFIWRVMVAILVFVVLSAR